MSLNKAMQDQHRAMIEKIDETEALLNAQVSKKFKDLRTDIDKMFGFEKADDSMKAQDPAANEQNGPVLGATS